MKPMTGRAAATMVCLALLIGAPAGEVRAMSATGEVTSNKVPGRISNAVHPGDPVQVIRAVGFEALPDALAFAAAGFEVGERKPVFDQLLERGASLAFAGSPFVVFSYTAPDGKKELLSITRCHGDLRLNVHSCGFQFLLWVVTDPEPTEVQEPRLR
jgi:hypothetical protein